MRPHLSLSARIDSWKTKHSSSSLIIVGRIVTSSPRESAISEIGRTSEGWGATTTKVRKPSPIRLWMRAENFAGRLLKCHQYVGPKSAECCRFPEMEEY
ncbi:MAG: hypothetical protein JRN20_19475, partial [Nitrososphaerota archaeon]|nr:hypothetical protein [Nitrososphaerota archaeon]